MAQNKGSAGCLIAIGIFISLVFWQIALPLIVIFFLVVLFGTWQAQGKALLAKEWTRRNRKKPCQVFGDHGLIDGLKSDAENLTLLFRPIEKFYSGGELPQKSYSIKWINVSLDQTIDALFKLYSVSILKGVSVEKTSIETALHCESELAWCINSLAVLTKMSDQIERALVLSKGNRLLEPSIPNFLEIKKRITEEGAKIVKARDKTSQMLEDIVEYLSVPAELRQSVEIDAYGHEVSARYVELKSSFDFLVDFNDTYTRLLP